MIRWEGDVVSQHGLTPSGCQLVFVGLIYRFCAGSGQVGDTVMKNEANLQPHIYMNRGIANGCINIWSQSNLYQIFLASYEIIIQYLINHW